MSRRGRTAWLVLPTVATVVLGLVVGTSVLRDRQERSEAIAHAERVGADYFAEVTDFRRRVESTISTVDRGDPVAVRQVLDEVLVEVPRLPKVGARGRSGSSTYRRAVATRAEVMRPYQRLRGVLDAAAVGEPFVAAARRVLDFNPTARLGALDSAAEVRGVLPELDGAVSSFRELEVPRGGRRARGQVSRAGRYMAGNLRVLATRIDQGQGYSFSWGEQYARADRAVSDFVTRTNGDVIEALDAISTRPAAG